MDLKEIKQILKMMDEHGLSEFLWEREGEKIELKSKMSNCITSQPIQVPTAIPTAIPTPIPVASEPAPKTSTGIPSTLKEIVSPIVGTFYAASNPNSESFVKIGSQVTEKTTVCIVEAMKILNEIKAEISGTITEICVTNGQPVEFGQVLFRVKP